MNERIQKLAKQAGFGLRRDGEIYTSRLEHLPITEDLAKFAELIVGECMACSTWVGKVNMNAIEPVHTAHAINQRIRQHFGVEE